MFVNSVFRRLRVIQNRDDAHYGRTTGESEILVIPFIFRAVIQADILGISGGLLALRLLLRRSADGY